MIKAYSGTDTYESYSEAKKTLLELAKKNNAEVVIINADDVKDIRVFLQNIEGIGMFTSNNVILAKRVFSNKNLMNYFIENFETLNNYNIILWEDEAVDGKLKLTKILKDKKVLFSFELPKAREFKSWVSKKAKELKIALTETQLDFISQNLEIDKWNIQNELSKISNYLAATKKLKITDQELEDILGFNVKGDMWKFLDSIGQRDKKKAIEEFEKLTFYEEKTQLLLTMLSREFRLIAQVLFAQKKGISAATLGIQPFVLQKTLSKSRKYSFKEVKKFMQKLFDLDFAIKRGDIDEKLGLTLFVLSL